MTIMHRPTTENTESEFSISKEKETNQANTDLQRRTRSGTRESHAWYNICQFTHNCRICCISLQTINVRTKLEK